MFSSFQRWWILLFSLWLLFLTGIFSHVLGTPGILQAVRLRNLLAEKNAHLLRAQGDLQKLQGEIAQLETSRFAQAREIRKVLGYAANDEIIFDFGLSENQTD